jgi:hypothetical protein
MNDFYPDYKLEECFERFERAAAKGHEESIWILSVVKDVKMEKTALKETFAKTEEPLGWYLAGEVSVPREAFDFYKKSAEGGCSWGQVKYGEYFENGWGVEDDEKVYMEWLEKAVKQNNPKAVFWLGIWFRYIGEEQEKALSYYRGAAELGWKSSVEDLAEMLIDGEGCETDLRQAAIWSAKEASHWFWNILHTARAVFEDGRTENLGCDFNQLCYSLGWGFYWYVFGTDDWDEDDAFSSRCLDYYCYCIELQQKSIFTFLLCWNQATGGVKGPGKMIAQMVWEEREDNLVKI